MAKDPAPHTPSATSKIDDRPFREASAEARREYGRFNLGIIGNTGVGKSSLVNAVFGRDLARVGKGMPVTEGVHYYHDGTLGIWDFEGFEIGSAKTPAEALRDNLATIRRRPSDEQISVVWYCVTANADRLTSADIALIRSLDAAGLPVIVVLTKVEWSKNPITGKYRAPKGVEEFAQWLENPVDGQGNPLDLPIRHVILTAAQGKGAGHGLGDLVATTLALSPESDKDAFRIAQRLNLPWKREMARRVITAGSSAAGAAAAVPIPVADAVTLAPIQLGMMGRIAAIYDLELTTMMSASAIAQLGTQMAGQALARSFLKLIPGAGSVINASVALALTGATGEAWMRLCEKVHTGDVDVSKIGDLWRDYSPAATAVIKKLVESRAGRK